ncbi:DUF4153 domain-containing protein [Anaerofustis sp. NSJ-163]|uniref:DUF4153 domain-containing protein n=1 Tax=Anaerofustis sp. NSJ-163 TaxID=2944391 RepID=UPI00209C0D78|nr:DUF4153 domain-containing protein [Anaerofustis sp. NSJ-163]MCO8192850.1 DUF4153 domain-containing protein [Anaerofustis sp. NSJ-163]
MKVNLHSFNLRLKESYRRFLSSFLFLIFYLLNTVIIYSLYITGKQFFSINKGLIIGVFTSIFINIFIENKKDYNNKKKNIISFVISALTAFIWSLVFYKYPQMQSLYSPFSFDYIINLMYFSFILILISITVYFLYNKNNEKALFSYIVKSLFISNFISFILFIGMMVCITAFDTLIIPIKTINISIITTNLCFVFINISLIIISIPKKDEEVIIPKFYKTIIKNILLPLFTVLIGILYVYILKIIITLNLPVGEMNIFASLALLGFVFLYLNLLNEEDNYSILYKKYGGYLMIPIIITQLIFIYIRLNAYGLTPARVLSIIFIVIGIIFLINSIIKKNVKYPFLIATVIIFIFTLTPLNIYNISNFNQEARLISILKENNMIKGEEIIKSNNISEEDKEKIQSAHEYLTVSIGKKSNFVKNIIEKKDTENLYGFKFKNIDEYYEFEDEYENTEYFSFYHDYENEEINIKEYNKMYELYIEGTKIDKHGINIDLYDYFYDLYENNKNIDTLDKKLIYDIDKNTRIVFTSIDFSIEKEKISDCTFSIYLLKK